MIEILYEDRSLLVAKKPCGVPSQGDKTGDLSMIELLQEQSGGPVLAVHRLDRAVSGVMVFAKTKKAAALLSEAMNRGEFEKEYLAAVSGAPPQDEGEFRDYLLHDGAKNMTAVTDTPCHQAKEAVLFYRRLKSSEDGARSLLLVRLGTGRTHQIRAQLAYHGMSILGDGKYGSDIKCAMGLFSHRLRFAHPFTKKQMSFSALPMPMTPWTELLPADMK